MSPVGVPTPASKTTKLGTGEPREDADCRAAASKLATIWRVTSCGYALTPSAATPWSAAATTIAASSRPGFASPRIDAIRTASSSSRPRLPRGFVFASRRRASAVSDRVDSRRAS